MSDSEEKIATEYFGGDERAKVVDPFKSDTPESKPSPGPWRWEQAREWHILVRECTPDELKRRALANQLLKDTTYEILASRDVEPADRALIAKAPEMAAMLRELEWADYYGGEVVCHICGEPRRKGLAPADGKHTPDCRLAALLRELP